MKKNILILLGLSILLTGCGYDEYEMPEDAYINFNENIFEVYNENYSDELIKDSNVEILTEKQVLETNEVGKKEITLSYKFKKRKYKIDVEYEVYDVKSPVFITKGRNITVNPGKINNLCQKILYADDYDDEPTCTVSGPYDPNQVGEYPNLEVTLTDSSLNETKDTFKLSVIKDDGNYYPSTPNYLYMNDILNNYKNDKTSIGVDVSKWQGSVDFNKVKKAGVEFVIMRIGYQSQAGGEYTMDPRYKEYLSAAKAAGLKIGVYLYNISASVEDGKKAAEWVLNNLNGEKLDFPIAYDWENWGSFTEYKMSLRHFTDAYLEFEKTLNAKGYEAMLYSSKFYLENVWQTNRIKTTWLAHYTSNTDYQGNYMMWQMTSLAKIDGITENTVDIDILYK